MQKKEQRKVSILKLVSGESVLAKVLKTSSGYEMTTPMGVALIPHPDPAIRETAVTLTDFITGADQEVIHIDKVHVIACVKADARLLELYERITNPSAIAQPPQPGLILPPGA